MNKYNEKSFNIFIIIIIVGIFLRFIVMTLGSNYDFESYCIVGEIAGNFRNVYAETSRYNYGPIFFVIQGLLCNISKILAKLGGVEWQNVFRVLMVTTLTIADLGITGLIAENYSIKKAEFFFLNPVSIFITGYHNQFDNIAILLALLCMNYYNEDENVTKNDMLFILFFTLSLITKHIMCFIPIFILLSKNLPLKKKMLYAFVPPILFLMSFIPFALSSKEAFQGIVNNVFLYRSSSNSPLLSPLYSLLKIGNGPRLYVYIAMLIIFAVLLRNEHFERILLTYTIAMVAFSSSLANQYLAIPMAALCILNSGVIYDLYCLLSVLFFTLETNGLALNWLVKEKFPTTLGIFSSWFVENGYIVICWLLFGYLLITMKKMNGVQKDAG